MKPYLFFLDQLFYESVHCLAGSLLDGVWTLKDGTYHLGPVTGTVSKETTGILSNLLVTLDDVIYGSVEHHKPGGVTGDNLGQNPGGCRDLLITAFVGYQTIQN